MSGAGATKAPIIFTGIRRQVVGPANFPAAPLKRVPLLGSLLTPDPLAPPKPNAPPSWGMQPPAPPSHWISELTDGIGKCLSFGCDEPQNAFAARTIDHIVKDWRNLLVGSHGYIAGERKSLESQQVGSGDLDRNGQVSHAAYMRLIEGSRATFIRGFGLEDPKNRKAWENMMLQNDIGFSLESIKIEFNFVSFSPIPQCAYSFLESYLQVQLRWPSGLYVEPNEQADHQVTGRES
ncbi:hypothetical protein GGS21DRAFT_497380 [Xylaria nigripes]|nr:hypothetical protein GGS21DRAFT_497380 [Xylaria nigripes]